TQEKKDNGDFDKTLTIDDAEQKRIEKDNMEKDNLSFGATTKKSKKKSPTKDNASNCRRCRVKFSFRCVRHHCNRCRLAFCINCAPVSRCDMGSEEQGSEATSLVKLCAPCKDELIFENSRGATRGLWSEFQKFRAEARNNRGLDVTSSTLHKHLESQTVLDVTPGLRNLCIKFLVTLHQQLQKQPRHKFLANYLHFENPIKQQVGNMKKVKNCHACDRYLRIMSDIRECGICKQVFCMACTWKTLQLYLPKGTDLRADINLEMIHFHIKETEVVGKDEVTAVEASELYRVCASCEDVVARNIHVYEFDAKVPQLEAELFDLQRQIDHCLTFSPYMLGIQPTTQLTKLSLDELMGTCVKHANNLYERYTRAYEILNNLMPQTGGQKALHKHIKQAMYDFYLKRRNQLNATFRDTDSCEDITAETGKSDKTSSPVSNL
ncbi:Amme syndrome candidate gene 1 protein homolog, partial [Plakobranchus ocellatus]